jgi:hypothetical protein
MTNSFVRDRHLESGYTYPSCVDSVELPLHSSDTRHHYHLRALRINQISGTVVSVMAPSESNDKKKLG